MTVKRATTLFITLLAMVCLSVSADAAATGKIIGEVINSKTGEPIIGASVMVVGTKRGAVTDFDGRYMIGQLEPGTYTLRITHLDFATVTVTDVVVTMDNVTEVPDGAIKRKAERDSTQSPPIVPEEVRKRETSVVTNEDGEIFIRGGRAGEVAYVTDGTPLSDPLGGLGQAGANLSPVGVKANGQIGGLITEAITGKPIKGASVIIVGTKHAAVTDSDGRFVIERAFVGRHEVVISRKGYKTTKVKDVMVGASDVKNFSHALEKIK